VPDLVRFIEDRDIWSGNTRERRLSVGPRYGAVRLCPLDRNRRLQSGAARRLHGAGPGHGREIQKNRGRYGRGRQPLTFNGVQGLMVNVPAFFTACSKPAVRKKRHLCPDVERRQERHQAGLRSQRNFDCIPLADSMGGGGHARPAASGCHRALPELLTACSWPTLQRLRRSCYAGRSC